jgi:hypothetical protein
MLCCRVSWVDAGRPRHQFEVSLTTPVSAVVSTCCAPGFEPFACSVVVTWRCTGVPNTSTVFFVVVLETRTPSSSKRSTVMLAGYARLRVSVPAP